MMKRGEKMLAEVAKEAAETGARRRSARSTGTVANIIDRLTTAETVATMMVETPGDLVAYARRCWPDLWQRILILARREGVSPGAQLLAIVEAGLAAEEESAAA
jgi:hypothetical protein